MTKEEQDIIHDLRKCDFRHIAEHYRQKDDELKKMSDDQKQVCSVEFSSYLLSLPP